MFMRKLPLMSLLAMSLAATALVGCKAVDAMDNTETMKNDLADMKGTTNKMKDGTDELTRLAKVADGKADLDMSKHHYDAYIPPPAEVLAGAKTVAENMTDEELTDYFFVRLKEFSETVPDPTQQDGHYLGGYSPDYVNSFNMEQMVRGVILQAIAGQIPQPMVEKLIDEQVNQGGERVPTIIAMLQLRAMFLDGFLLDKDIFDQPFASIGIARKADEEIGYLRYITHLSFAQPEIKQGDADYQAKCVAQQPADPGCLSSVGIAIPSVSFLPTVVPAQYRPGDADYQAKCMVQKPADSGCAESLGSDPGSQLYNQTLDVTMDQPWWKKLARKINGYVDCNGRKHAGELPAKLLDRGSNGAAEFMNIYRDALSRFPPDTCPARR